MRFQVNDIVASAPGYSPAVFVITAINPSNPKNPYEGTSLKNFKAYRLGDDGLASKRIGVADPGWNTVTLPAAADGSAPVNGDHNYIKGLQRVNREIAMLGGGITGAPTDDFKRWEKLQSLKPGDKFPAKVRKGIQHLTFRYVTDRGYKYVFVADNENGTRYKYPLSAVMI